LQVVNSEKLLDRFINEQKDRLTFLESEIDKVPKLNNVVRGQGEALGTLKKNANLMRDDFQ
jgi:hypothetical protein